MNHATRADKAALSSFRKVCFRLCQSNMDWRGLKGEVSIVHLRFLIVGIQEYDVRSLTDVISWDALTMVRELSGSPYWFYRLLAEAALRAKLDRDAPRVEVEDVRAARAAMQEMAAASYGSWLGKPLETLRRDEVALLVANGLALVARDDGSPRVVENPLFAGVSMQASL